jgi:hypothetical protein
MMKLGSDNLNKSYFSSIDHRLAGSSAGIYMRLRLQDISQLLADALISPLAAQPRAPVHLLNIGGGPAIDSMNALILVRKERPDLLAGRQIFIHSCDLNTAGPNFGARALSSLLAEGSPLFGLQISFQHTDYNWSDQSELLRLVRSFEDEQGVVAASSEGALFEYGIDEAIAGNLQALHEFTPGDTVIAGSLTRADDLGRRANGAGLGSRAAIQFRSLDSFTAMALRCGWKITKCIDRPLSHDILMEKA